jgi:hypothetical protein
MVRCLCGGEYGDHEEWVTHVRHGMPIPCRPSTRIKMRQKEREQEQIALGLYIERHRVIESEFLSERKTA